MLWVAERERCILADRQGLVASGVRENLPEPKAERRKFLEWLASDPRLSEPIDERAELRRTLRAV